jgi:hypothetical protein
MNMLEVEARETLKVRGKLNIDRDDLNQYLYYDEALKISFDEYITDRFEDTLELDFPVSVENLLKLMKDNGLYLEYMNKYFNEFFHDYKMETDEYYRYRFKQDETVTLWDDYCNNTSRYV